MAAPLEVQEQQGGDGESPARVRRWYRVMQSVMAAVLAAGVVATPLLLYRSRYVESKRLREVTPGVLYRAGQMTAAGLRAAIERYGIRTVVNLQHESPDPLLSEHWLGRGRIKESELCAAYGVRYVVLAPDILPPDWPAEVVPPVVDEFLAVMDDPANHPVLLHCRAGLHRTGRLSAIYRMEYEGWSVGEALRELRAHGYGYLAASEQDEFVVRFLKNYRRRAERQPPVAPYPRAAPPEAATPLTRRTAAPHRPQAEEQP